MDRTLTPRRRHAGWGGVVLAVLLGCAGAGHDARAQAWGNAGWPGALSSPMAGIMHQQAASSAQAWQGTMAHMRAQHDSARAAWSADARAGAAARQDMNRPTPGRDAPDNTDRPAIASDVPGDDPYARDWSRFEREEARLRQQMRNTP